MTDESVALETIADLPENSSMQDLAEELQVTAAIRKGKTDVKAGRTKSHAEIEKTFATWISQ